MKTAEQLARIEANKDAVATNPVLNNSRLAELTSWDAPWAGLRVVVVGLGVSGDAAADVLAQKGAHVVAIDAKDTAEKRERIRLYDQAYGHVSGLFGQEHMSSLPLVDGQEPDVVVVSPGIRPDSDIMLDAYERGVQVWSEVELAWRLNTRAGRRSTQWLCLTGTNGKTTTVGMVDSILKAAGRHSAQVGNVGLPIVYAVADDEEYEFFAVELSSFQLHWTYSLSPLASVVLNVADDHVDWHGSFEAYKAAKARIYENTQVACIFNEDHADTRRMVEEADVVEGARAVLIIGTDSAALMSALATHAGQVPVYNLTASVANPTDGAAAMEAAVIKAREVAEPGDVVLMAPAAASMDQFKNYAERGNAFVEAVQRAVGEGISTT